MSLINRYRFLRKIFLNTLIIFYKKNYYCIYLDKYIFERFSYDINLLEKNKINFLIIDNLTIKKYIVFKNNNYEKYSKIAKIERFLLNEIIIKL